MEKGSKKEWQEQVELRSATSEQDDHVPTGCNITSSSGELAEVNPIRYRGYYYDDEINMYYLQSRYYDQNVGRFINSDDTSMLIMAQGNIIDSNLFLYCRNNEIMNIDPSGFWKISLSTYWTGIVLDLLITIILPYIFTAFKATRLVKWAKCSKWFKGLYTNAINKISKLIYNAMDRILYKIMGRAANAATRAFTLKRVQSLVGKILDFSIGYGIAFIIDYLDRDGRSGYIRF